MSFEVKAHCLENSLHYVLNPRVCGRRSLKDILFKKRMERQLAAARGLGPMGDSMPGEGGEGGIPTAGSRVSG